MVLISFFFFVLYVWRFVNSNIVQVGLQLWSCPRLRKLYFWRQWHNHT